MNKNKELEGKTNPADENDNITITAIDIIEKEVDRETTQSTEMKSITIPELDEGVTLKASNISIEEWNKIHNQWKNNNKVAENDRNENR